MVLAAVVWARRNTGSRTASVADVKDLDRCPVCAPLSWNITNPHRYPDDLKIDGVFEEEQCLGHLVRALRVLVDARGGEKTEGVEHRKEPAGNPKWSCLDAIGSEGKDMKREVVAGGLWWERVDKNLSPLRFNSHSVEPYGISVIRKPYQPIRPELTGTTIFERVGSVVSFSDRVLDFRYWRSV